METLYRGCHGVDEFLRILLYRTAGGWGERFAHRVAPEGKKTTKAAASGSRECTTERPLNFREDQRRTWHKKVLVEYGDRNVASSYVRYGMVEIKVPGLDNWTGAGEGYATFASEPLMYVVGYKGLKGNLDIISNPRDCRFLYGEVKSIIEEYNLGYLLPRLEEAKKLRWTIG